MNTGHWNRCLGAVALTALLLVTACAPSPTTPTPVSETLTYTNSEYGYSVEYPKDWLVEDRFGQQRIQFPGSTMFKAPRSPMTRRGVVAIYIMADDFSEEPEMTLEEYVSQYDLEWSETRLDYEKVNEHDFVVDGLAGIEWSWKQDVGGMAFLGTMANFMTDDVGYAIAYFAPVEAHDHYFYCFELMLNTFKFD